MPFSDPLADGPVIQRATERALAAGTTLRERPRDARERSAAASRAPIVIFSYANPILRMGLDDVRRSAPRRRRRRRADPRSAARGSARRSATAFDAAGIDTIFLLSPTTTDERIRRAAELGSGFLYGISRLGVTGVRDTVDDRRASWPSASRRRRRCRSRSASASRGPSTSPSRPVGRRRGRRQRAGQGDRRARTGAPGLLDEVERYVRWLRN